LGSARSGAPPHRRPPRLRAPHHRDARLRGPATFGPPGARPRGGRPLRATAAPMGPLGPRLVGEPATRRRPAGLARQRPEPRRSPAMPTATIPVDLFAPGQVFACLGFMEAADQLLGGARAGFDWSDPADTRFALATDADLDPFEAVLSFLEGATVQSLAPHGS